MHFSEKAFPILFGFLLHPIFVLGASTIKIDSALLKSFDKDAKATKNIIVEFDQKPSTVLDKFSTASVTTEADRSVFREKFTLDLKMLSTESQEPLQEFMRDKTNEHESFWVTNQFFIKGATKEMIESISKLPNVATVREEKVYHILKPVEEGPVTHGREGGSVSVLEKGSTKATSVEWNVQKIHANDMWDKVANSGEKTCVGVIDTGVNPNHEAFPTGMVIGWKDAVGKKTTPYDDNGHGTHVTGTIAGNNGIGVAPGVHMIHCKACTGSGSCSESALTSCCQFMTDHKPAPNVVSNSWGGPSGTSAYADVINGWKALNIFSCFAAGNEGPSCKTIGSPADYANVGCSVGATTSSDGLADFSSRGTYLNGKVGPTVSAPGQGINSAWNTGNKDYKKLSGTSMATPHVAGQYALIHSQNPTISFEDAQKAIVNSCVSSGLADPGQTCGGTSFTKVPNNLFGNGRIDCTKAAELASKLVAKHQVEQD